MVAAVAADHGNRVVVVADNSTTQKQGTSAIQTPVPCFVILAEQLLLAALLTHANLLLLAALLMLANGSAYFWIGILSRRRWWRPPSNSVSSHVSSIANASSLVMKRAGMQSTFELLCWRESFAISGIQQSAARIA